VARFDGDRFRARQKGRPESDRTVAEHFPLHLGGCSLRNNESCGRANGKTPAGRAISLSDCLHGLEKLGPAGLQSTIRTGYHHREQAGVEQRLGCAVGQTSHKLGFASLAADNVIDRLGPL
jgi:hypothetical protein